MTNKENIIINIYQLQSNLKKVLSKVGNVYLVANTKTKRIIGRFKVLGSPNEVNIKYTKEVNQRGNKS